MRIQQDASIHAVRLAAGDKAEHGLPPGRRAWLQVANGELSLNGRPLAEGDGAAIEGESALALAGMRDAEGLLFELP